MRRIILILSVVAGIFLFCSAGAGRCAAGEVSSKVIVGLLADFPPGSMKTFLKEKLIVFHDADGVYAMSLACTHKGCLVSFSKGDIGRCPCHGALFNKDGSVARGPAQQNLPWFFVSLDEQGYLYVDEAVPVPLGTKYKFE